MREPQMLKAATGQPLPILTTFIHTVLQYFLVLHLAAIEKNVPTKIRYAFVTPVYELHVRVVLGFIPS